LKSLAGSSAGALVSLLLTVGYTNAEIFKLILELDLSALLNPKVELLFSEYGIENGDAFVKILEGLLREKSIPIGITLHELFVLTGKRLIITVSCLGKGVRYLDHLSAPNISAIKAVRMSVSIPFLVTPVLYQGDYYVDGGLLDNAPIALFSREAAHTVLTVRVDNLGIPSKNSVECLEDFFGILLATVAKEMSDLRLKNVRKHDKTAINVSCGMHKLVVNEKEKKELFRIGYHSAKEYLSSDEYLHLRIESLPENIAQKIWKLKHDALFSEVIQELSRVSD
jgi:NTE family protein